MNKSGSVLTTAVKSVLNQGSSMFQTGLSSPFVKYPPFATNLTDVATAVFERFGLQESQAVYGNTSPSISVTAQIFSASVQFSDGKEGLAATSWGVGFQGKDAQGVGPRQ